MYYGDTTTINVEESAAGPPEAGSFTPIPDVLLDEFLAELSGSEIKVMLYIARRTYGFQKQHDEISVSQMERGITKRDGTVLDRGTGLTRRSIISCVGSLVDKGLLMKVRNYDPRRGDTANTYCMTPPKPCDSEEAASPDPGCKNYTPRVQKLHPQERVGQKRVDSVSYETGANGSESPSTPTTNISKNGKASTQGKLMKHLKEHMDFELYEDLDAMLETHGRAIKILLKQGVSYPRLLSAAEIAGSEAAMSVQDGLLTSTEKESLERALSDTRTEAGSLAQAYLRGEHVPGVKANQNTISEAAAEMFEGTTGPALRKPVQKALGYLRREAIEDSGQPENAGETENRETSYLKEGYEWFFGE